MKVSNSLNSFLFFYLFELRFSIVFIFCKYCFSTLEADTSLFPPLFYARVLCMVAEKLEENKIREYKSKIEILYIWSSRKDELSVTQITSSNPFFFFFFLRVLIKANQFSVLRTNLLRLKIFLYSILTVSEI